MRKKLFYILFIMIQLLLVFIVAEIGTRIIHPQKTYSELKKSVGNYYDSSPFNLLTLKKNYRGTEPSQEYPGQNVLISINSLGLRGEEVEYNKEQNKKRILILGDSYTFGVYVNNNETYSAVLETELTKKGYDVKVLNAGYADGFETDEEYNWLVNEGLKFQPDIIILGFFNGNDVTGIKKENWVKTDERDLPVYISDSTVVTKDGIIKASKDDNKSVGSEFIYRIPVLRESQFLVGVARKINVFKKKLSALINNENLTPPGYSLVYYPQLFGESANDFYLKYYDKDYLGIIKDFNEKDALFKKLVLGMNSIAEKNNSKFLVLMIPFNFQVEPDYFLPLIFRDDQESKAIKNGVVKLNDDYFMELKSYFTENHINHIDVLESMKTGKEKYYPRNGEVHFNPAGHIFVADLILQYLLDNKWLSL